jgi:hypothetical protein
MLVGLSCARNCMIDMFYESSTEYANGSSRETTEVHRHNENESGRLAMTENRPHPLFLSRKRARGE